MTQALDGSQHQSENPRFPGPSMTHTVFSYRTENETGQGYQSIGFT